MSVDRPPVGFFLDEDVSPMVLCAVHDEDGPDEVEVVLGTFLSRTDALGAMDAATQILQDPKMRWANAMQALTDVQTVLLRYRENLGLPRIPPTAASESHAPSTHIQEVEPGDQDDLAATVLASTKFKEQRERAKGVSLSDQQVGSLLRQLIAAPGHRINQATAAIALGVPLLRLNGAFPMAQRLLNVEQYPVVGRDTDGVTIRLDMHLLEEQFGVQR